MKQRDYARGCRLIEQSWRLEALPGALFTLAECTARAGRRLSALRHFGEYLELVGTLGPDAQSGESKRVEAAVRRRLELARELSGLRIEITAGAPADATLELDGERIARDAWGKVQPLDPGTYRVVLRLADGRESVARIELVPGEQRNIRLPLPAHGDPQPTPTPAATATEPDQTTTSLQVGGGVALGLGVVGLVVAGATGIILLRKKENIEANCVGTTCNPNGYADAEDVPTLNVVGSVSFAVGAASAATGIALLVIAALREGPERAEIRIAPEFGRSAAVIHVSSRW